MIEHTNARESRDVRIPPLGLAGILQIPKNAYALVVFAHGSGSSRLSPRKTAVATSLNDWGIATLGSRVEIERTPSSTK
jgi:predicted alpha/beta-hydrolase family hydrolase